MTFLGIHLEYLLRGNYVHAPASVELKISPSATLHNVKIYVSPGAKLEIGNDCRISNVLICVEKGECIIHEKCIIGPSNKNQTTNIIINDGSMHVGHHTKLSLERIWIRFGGGVRIGNYTNINGGSEIRSDDSVKIGNYNQISYGVRIWDTNTHSILSKDERRRVTEMHYPYYGYESSKPKTSPVCIGDDCWIGEKASILKGTKLGDEIIVGYNCLLSGQEISNKSVVVTKSVLDVRRIQ